MNTVDRMCEMAEKVQTICGGVTKGIQFSNRFMNVFGRADNPLEWTIIKVIEMWVQECWGQK